MGALLGIFNAEAQRRRGFFLTRSFLGALLIIATTQWSQKVARNLERKSSALSFRREAANSVVGLAKRWEGQASACPTALRAAKGARVFQPVPWTGMPVPLHLVSKFFRPAAHSTTFMRPRSGKSRQPCQSCQKPAFLFIRSARSSHFLSLARLLARSLGKVNATKSGSL